MQGGFCSISDMVVDLLLILKPKIWFLSEASCFAAAAVARYVHGKKKGGDG